MRTRFDQLGKQIGEQALGPSGRVVIHDEIAPEVQYADLRYEPDPARAPDRARLGLLGRLASGPCLFELYSEAPDGAELRACLSKHLASWQHRVRREAREARGAEPRSAAVVEPSLWIVAAGTPAGLIATLGLAPAHGWPAGVYLFGGDVLRVGLVAAGELPRDRSTLLVRFMAGGSLLRRAIAELRELPADSAERLVAGPVLLRLHHALERKPSRTAEEEEIIVATQDFFEYAHEQGWEKGWEKGRAEGRAESRAGDVLTVLRVRGIPVSETERARILAERDPERLERWLERAIVERSVEAVLGEPS